MINKCAKVIQYLEADCYRPDGNYTITECPYQLDDLYDSVSKHNGRAYYSVWFFYNYNTEQQKEEPLQKATLPSILYGKIQAKCGEWNSRTVNNIYS